MNSPTTEEAAALAIHNGDVAFIAAALDFSDAGPERFKPGYDEYRDVVLAASRLTTERATLLAGQERAIAEAVGLLRSFAKALDDWGDEPEYLDNRDIYDHPLSMCITLGDFRKVSAFLARHDASDGGGA